MGERKKKRKWLDNALVKAVQSTLEATVLAPTQDIVVATKAGRIQVRWDNAANATAMGQLVFFAEFLDFAGVFERWIEHCPLNYTSGNASSVRDVLGTLMLSILDGQHRYTHVAGLRGDGVAPAILGMQKIISDEALRRALKAIAPAAHAKHDDDARQAQIHQLARAQNWMQDALFDSVQNAFDTPWILDCDPTVKPLYGQQSGAEVGYNAKKPGRPSHTIHTYWISALRLVIGAELQSGKANSARHSLPQLDNILTKLLPRQRPKLVRADCAFGNETLMCALERLSQPYLFKLKQSANVKRLLAKQWRYGDWADLGQGWQGREDTLMLMGWSQPRRVIVMRRQIRGDLIVETSTKSRKGGAKTTAKTAAKAASPKRFEQQSLTFINTFDTVKVYEHVVLVTNSSYDTQAIGQLYRDRADCENGFDELKNQWGWGGYCTQDIERCNITAQAVALVYNWWSWYCRLAHPQAHLEAITSRPLMLAAIGKVTEHAGQKKLLLTTTHAAVAQVKALVANVQAGLELIRVTAPQLTQAARWRALVTFICSKINAAMMEKANRANAPPIIMAV